MCQKSQKNVKNFRNQKLKEDFFHFLVLLKKICYNKKKGREAPKIALSYHQKRESRTE